MEEAHSRFHIPASAAGSTSLQQTGSHARAAAATAVDEYAWEKQYERTWDTLVEDEHGHLRTTGAQQGGRRRRQDFKVLTPSLKRGLVRYLQVVVDMSEAMGETDLRPNRAVAAIDMLRSFVGEFFNENPLSSMGIAKATKSQVVPIGRGGGDAKLFTSSRQLQARLTFLEEQDTETVIGDMSFEASLLYAVQQLASVPHHGNRELLIIHGSIASIDAGNVLEALAEAKRQRLRVSVIGLAGELRIAKHIAQETGGDFAVADGEVHFRQLLANHKTPPPKLREAGEEIRVRMVPMGFPSLKAEQEALLPSGRVTCNGYTCPRCLSRAAEVPSECSVCGLKLASSTHLARSYHHLFPVSPFVEVPSAAAAAMEPWASLAMRGIADTLQRWADSQPAADLAGGAAMVDEEAAENDAAGLAAAAVPLPIPPLQRLDRFIGRSDSGSGVTVLLIAVPVRGGRAEKEPAEQPAGGRGVGGGTGGQEAIAQRWQPQALSVRAPAGRCCSCFSVLGAETPRYVCLGCQWTFCAGCDEAVHDSLHICPGCSGPPV